MSRIPAIEVTFGGYEVIFESPAISVICCYVTIYSKILVLKQQFVISLDPLVAWTQMGGTSCGVFPSAFSCEQC
jgi:hypothetical protein